MPDNSAAAIEFVNVSYRLPSAATLLCDVNLTVRRGETLVLLGRSGSGKTTCLRMINGLLRPTSGEVRVAGKPVAQWDLIELRRSTGYAIQDVGLFPHYTVRENVSLVPRLQKWDRRKIDQRVTEVMDLVGLPIAQFADRYPHQLSGGQRQRAGLARALAADPPILLMDEPFGALDPITRAEVQEEFSRLQKRLQKTNVFVTHDVPEALMLATRIALLEDGRLQGTYYPEEFLVSRDPIAAAYSRVYRTASQARPGDPGE